MGKQLRVLARGAAMVPVHSAHAAGQRRFVGRVYDESLGRPYTFRDDRNLAQTGIAGVYVASAEPTVLDQDVLGQEWFEYFHAVAQGDLWPADQATAAMCGVPFDPSFGGEYVRGAGGLVNVAHDAAINKSEPALGATNGAV